MGANNEIYLGIGHVSHDEKLGAYYQDFTAAMYHFENNSLGEFDEKGIPYLIESGRKYYSVVAVIQYGLILHDLILRNENNLNYKAQLLNCLNWLIEKSEIYKDSIVWRSEENTHYHLEKGWISAMYQGQAISLFLRAAQMFEDEKYIKLSMDIFKFFKYDYSDGGVKRIDNSGNIWFEEYPTDPPSYVFNGFVYTVFGILDFYRFTKNREAKELYYACIETIEKNIHKYDRFYWTVYDQLKKELVSYYYQKNVHIPLVSILYLLTKNEKFDKLEKKWSKQKDSKLNQALVSIMYRIQPRIIKFLK